MGRRRGTLAPRTRVQLHHILPVGDQLDDDEDSHEHHHTHVVHHNTWDHVRDQTSDVMWVQVLSNFWSQVIHLVLGSTRSESSHM